MTCPRDLPLFQVGAWRVFGLVLGGGCEVELLASNAAEAVVGIIAVTKKEGRLAYF